MSSNDGKIAAILSRTRVVINRGSKDGVEKGDHFVIYSKLGPFYDPDTQENLGTTTEVWGKVNVRTVEERFCVAETEYEIRHPFERTALAALFGTTSEQIRLPVDEGQIQKGLTRIEVGFLAKLIRQVGVREKKIEALPPAQPKELPQSGEGDSAPEQANANHQDT